MVSLFFFFMYLLAICISLEYVSLGPFKEILKSIKMLARGLGLVADHGRTLS